VSQSVPLLLAPGVEDLPGASDRLRAIQRWVVDHGLPDLPPEHQALVRFPFGVRLDLTRLADTSWTEVFFSQHTTVGLGTWVTWSGPEGDGARFMPPGVTWAISPLLFELMQRLAGDEIELHYALAGQMPLLPRGTWVHPDGWWDEWKSRPLGGEDESVTLGSVYRGWLYPRVMGCLRAAESGGMPITQVVDVCGGDGELAEAVGVTWPDAVITVLERNAKGCEASGERLAAPHRVVQGDVSLAETWEGLHDVDVVLMTGAIQGNVMGAGAAEATVKLAAAALRPGGLAVVTGWSPCLLDTAGFEAAGFEVRNMAVPPTPEDANPRQFYVLVRAGLA
jgi:hypothetical protein